MDEHTRQQQALLRRFIKRSLVQLVKGCDYARTLTVRLYDVLAYQDIILSSIIEEKGSWDRINSQYGLTDDLSDDPSESLEFYLEKYEIPITTQQSHHNPNAAMHPDVREFVQKELHRVLTEDFRNPRTETKHIPTMRLDSTMLCLCTTTAKGVGEYLRQGITDDRFKQFEDHAEAANKLHEYSGLELGQLLKEIEPQMYDCGVVECPISRQLHRSRDNNDPSTGSMGVDSIAESRRPPGSHYYNSESSNATVDGDVVIRNQETGRVVVPLPESETSTPKVISRNEKNREKKASKRRVKQRSKQQSKPEELGTTRATSPHFKDTTPKLPRVEASRTITPAENTLESGTSKVTLDSTEQVIPDFARLEAVLESSPGKLDVSLDSSEREDLQDSTLSNTPPEATPATPTSSSLDFTEQERYQDSTSLDAPPEVTPSKPASLESTTRGTLRRHMSEEPLLPAETHGIQERELPRENPSNRWWVMIMEDCNRASAGLYPVAAADSVDTEPRQPVVQMSRTDLVIINSSHQDRLALADKDEED